MHGIRLVYATNTTSVFEKNRGEETGYDVCCPQPKQGPRSFQFWNQDGVMRRLNPVESEVAGMPVALDFLPDTRRKKSQSFLLRFIHPYFLTEELMCESCTFTECHPA